MNKLKLGRILRRVLKESFEQCTRGEVRKTIWAICRENKCTNIWRVFETYEDIAAEIVNRTGKNCTGDDVADYAASDPLTFFGGDI
jgi:hypothetical protein